MSLSLSLSRGLLLLVLVLPSPPSVAAADSRVGRLLQRGDKLLRHVETASAAWKAIGYFREAKKAGASSFAVNWRLSWGYYLLSRIAKRNGHADQGTLAHRGFRYGVRATREAPKRVEGHFWAALSIGSYGETLGIISALRNGIRGKLRRYLDAALRLDPGYDRGGPDRVLAIYYHSVPWPFKNNGKSLRHFRQSLRHDPDNPSTYFFFAKTLADIDRKDEARKLLARCLRVSTTDRGDRRFQRKCRTLLGELDN